jgi:hypothetical protein
MSIQPDPRHADNLRRWLDSGQPRTWVDSRCGHWGHGDWLTLLGNLRHSEFWPLDPDGVGTLLERLREERANLVRLIDSGLPRRWVRDRRGEWCHAEWLILLDSLREAGFWPIHPEALLRVMEGLRAEWQNLRRWEQSGEPRRWVEARGGQWDHDDWLALVRALQRSDLWPLDLEAVGEILERLKARGAKFRRWVESGWPRRWVEQQRGRWGDAEWLVLLEALQRSAYWPLDLEEVRAALEESRLRYWNLRRWEWSGQARAWVEARAGEWNHEDWLALLEDLRQSELWPLDPDAVGELLQEMQQEWRNLRRWQESGQDRKWVEARQGRWGREDWLALLGGLRQSEFWPLNLPAAEKELRRVTAEWWNLRRWRESGQPWLWVKARRGQWGHEDWLALLDNLRQSQFWPLAPAAVGQVLEQVKREYGNLRRWLESGHPRRWVELRQGRWGRSDWLALLRALQQSEFWPLDPAMARAALEEITGEGPQPAAPSAEGTGPPPRQAA